jgi:hypothetical protein
MRRARHVMVLNLLDREYKGPFSYFLRNPRQNLSSATAAMVIGGKLLPAHCSTGFTCKSRRRYAGNEVRAAGERG